MREEFDVSLEELMRPQIAEFDVAEVFCGLRFVPDHCTRSLVSGNLRCDGRRIALPPKDLGALNPALGCVASAEGLTKVYQSVLTGNEWRQTCASNAMPIRPDRRYPLYSLGLTHFRSDRSGPDVLGHVGIYNGCTGATLHHPGLRMAASLQLDRIDLDCRPQGEYRMIFAERFLLALFQLIIDDTWGLERDNAANVESVLVHLAD
jgi:hypothetical protein